MYCLVVCVCVMMRRAYFYRIEILSVIVENKLKRELLKSKRCTDEKTDCLCNESFHSIIIISLKTEKSYFSSDKKSR